MKVSEVCRQLEVSAATDYRWRTKYGGMAPQRARQLQDLQQENARPKKLVADQTLDMLILKEAACPNGWPPDAGDGRWNVFVGVRGMTEARYVVAPWRLDYNHHRPHGGLNWMKPASYAARRRGQPSVIADVSGTGVRDGD